MIAVIEDRIKNIPSLVVVDEGKTKDALPTVVYFHGFTSAKEHNLPLAYLLAQEGFRVILPDSYLHGAREEDITNEKFQLSFWDIVLKNLDELTEIKSYLDENNLLAKGQLGIAGTSMGGITTGAALRKYDWIDAGAILMGSPKPLDFAKDLIEAFEKGHGKKVPQEETEPTLTKLEAIDLSKDISSLRERPLFLWHGDADRVVPFDQSHSFYEEAKKHYRNKDLIRFSREKDRDHKVSRPAILNTVNWFSKHLVNKD